MKKNLSDKNKIKIILFLIFIIMLILNCLTPIIDDDFGYSLNLDKEHLTGLRDIANFQIIHYKMWGGRTVAHTIAQIFLWLPKWIFNISNSLCFCLLIYLIYNISKKEKKDKPHLLIIIFFLIYFLLPVFGQNCLWLIGSCNYLWTTTIILFFINEYIHKKRKDKLLTIIIFFFLGIIAGWTNENTSFGLITIIFFYLLLLKYSKEKIFKWQISGLIGNILGFLILIFAPGNYARTAQYKDETFFILKILKRFIDCSKGLVTFMLPIFIILIILITIHIYNKKKKINKITIIFLIGSIITTYAMVLSPTFPERAWFGIFIFAIIAIINLTSELERIFKNYYKFIIIDIIAILLLIFINDYIELFTSINELKNTWDYRINYINKHKNKKIIYLEPYYTNNKKNPNYLQDDINKDPEAWPNNDIERYFKVKKISIK